MVALNREITRIKKALLTGVGYMIPFVVLGGILIALSIALSGVKADEGAVITNPFLEQLLGIGETSFNYMIPILAGFIAFGMAERAGICPGMVAGALAVATESGFLGAILGGIIAGYLVMFIRTWKIPRNLKALTPIFIIPLCAGITVALIMVYIIAPPMAALYGFLNNWLANMSTGNAIILAIILGVMTAFDMGGPVNVIACLFAWGLYSEGNYLLGGPVAVAICTPPLGMGLATFLSKKKYDEDDREAGKAALAMGLIGISEGAIPFAAKDPLRVLPAICIGGAVGSVAARLLEISCYAPHGGPIVTLVTDKPFLYLICIIFGSVVTALLVNAFKKKVPQEEVVTE